MGFLEKMKNLFTEEEEIIEEPVKKEVMQVEIKAPAKEIKNEPVEKELIDEMIKPTVTKPAPVFFDDKDFASLEKPKPKPAPAKRVERTTYNNTKMASRDRHSFKPSPIISPVYGVLDKNYKKEDIIRREEKRTYTTSKEMTIDEIRKKAFGTLEDEIDMNLNKEPEKADNLVDINSFDNDTLENDIFEEMENDDAKNVVTDTLEDDVMLGNVETFDLEDELEKNNSEEENLNNTEGEQLDESDLFNLIDSMYEKRDEN